MLSPIPFQVIRWSEIKATLHPGETGEASWQTMQYGDLRIRIVRYSAGYLADHWCQKGHIVHCLEGSFVSEMENGERYELTTGMTYAVSDHMSSHRSVSEKGVTLLIIDGGFLKP